MKSYFLLSELKHKLKENETPTYMNQMCAGCINIDVLAVPGAMHAERALH